MPEAVKARVARRPRDLQTIQHRIQHVRLRTSAFQGWPSGLPNTQSAGSKRTERTLWPRSTSIKRGPAYRILILASVFGRASCLPQRLFRMLMVCASKLMSFHVNANSSPTRKPVQAAHVKSERCWSVSAAKICLICSGIHIGFSE